MKKQTCRKIIIIFIFLLIILVSISSFLSSYIARNQQEISNEFRERFGLVLNIGSIQSHWFSIHPTIVLENVEILSPTKTSSAVHLKKISLQIQIFRSLYAKKIIFKNIEIVGSSLEINRLPNNSLSINGLLFANSNGSMDLQDYMNVDWYLHNIDLTLKDAKHNFRMNNLTIKHSLYDTQIYSNDAVLKVPFSDNPILIDNLRLAFDLSQINRGQVIFKEMVIKNNWLNLYGNAEMLGHESLLNFIIKGEVNTQSPEFKFIEKFAAGSINFKAEGSIHKNKMDYDYILKFESNLLGLNIKLPAPLNKTSAQNIPLNIKINKNNQNIEIVLDYQNKLYANLLAAQGSADAWRVNVNKVSLGQYHLDKTQLIAKYSKNQWLLAINNSQLAGTITIPTNLKKTVYMNFKHLTLSSQNFGSQSSLPDIKPQQIPPLNIYFNRVYYDKHTLGTISLKTRTQNKTLLIEKFVLANHNLNLKMKGYWRGDGSDKTLLAGHASTKNLGKFLKDWQISESLIGTKGTLDFKLNWNAPIYNLSFSQLNGNFRFILKDGVIVDVMDSKYELLGRIFNVFSINSLEFIFSEPFQLIAPKRRGFDFDSADANFSIRNGVTTTNNFYLHGKLAEIEAYGQIDLVRQRYNLNIEITPFLTSFLPAKLASASGPLILGVVWVSDKLMGGVLNGFYRQYYYVTGPWVDPHYQRLQGAPYRGHSKKLCRS